ncbi:MAG: helix-turn-helix domain-containing protein, partial [Mesorhizobium sp.]
VGVCERTIYRYIRLLRAAGEPILSEAGMGYMLKKRTTPEVRLDA